MEQLIKQLNNQSNRPSPDEIREIERRIQNLQREFSGWRLGVDLLGNEDPLVRFYGALTLTIKINADWYVNILSYRFSIRPGFSVYSVLCRLDSYDSCSTIFDR
jgi:hypothetical protein